MTTQAPGNGQSTQMTQGAQGAAVVKGPQGRLNTLKALFEKAKPNIAAVLPKHLTPERLIKIVTSAASRTPELLDCTPESVLLAVVQAGTLGIEPNNGLHHCALVPFNNKHTSKKEATLIVEYRGLIALAYNSGEVESIYAEILYEKDEYAIEYGTNKRLFHRPLLSDERGDILGFYAVIKFKRGATDFVFMPKSKVDAIRAKSPGAHGDAWSNHYEEMGKKTAIRRLSKTMPMSIDRTFAKAVEINDRSETGQAPDYGDIIDVIGEIEDPATGEMVATGTGATRSDAARDRIQAKAAAS